MIEFLSAIGVESRADLKSDQFVANCVCWSSVLRAVPTRPGSGSGHRAGVAASALCCLGLILHSAIQKNNVCFYVNM